MTACYKFPDIEGKDKEERANNEKLYAALVFLLRDRFGLTPEFPKDIAGLEAIPFQGQANSPVEAALPFVITTYGLLELENFTNPLVGRADNAPDVTVVPPGGAHAVKFARPFVEQVTSSVEEYQGSKDMFEGVFKTLAKQSHARSSGKVDPSINAGQVAEVGRRLIEERRDPHDPQIEVRIENVLSLVLGDGVEGRASAINISLPSLDEDTTADIISDNVKALAAVYFAAQLEELKFFATADKVVEHFTTGMLPLTRGPGGQAIYEYLKGAPNRLTEVERRSLYARAFGFAQGSVDEPLPNREFQDAWIRFLSVESQFVRLFGTAAGANNSKVVLQGPLVQIVQVFKAAKDLAVNLSLHGYGIAHFAAVELQQLVRDVKRMLSYDDVLKSYGVLDVWQLVERVSQLYLGGSVNGVQKRTMATAGANIILWLAQYAPLLSAPTSNKLADLILNPKPGDVENISGNVDRWLAVTGTGDDAVEKYSEPVAIPTQATIPNLSLQSAIPDSLKSVLSQVGGGLPAMPAMPSLTTNGVAKA